MGIVRLLIVLIIVWFVWSIYRRYIQQQTRKPPLNSSTAKNNVPSVKQCAFCGVHIPLEEAIQRKGRYYCCQSHCDKDVQ